MRLRPVSSPADNAAPLQCQLTLLKCGEGEEPILPRMTGPVRGERGVAVPGNPALPVVQPLRPAVPGTGPQ